MHAPPPIDIARVSRSDRDQVEESRRRIEDSLRLLRQPFWPDHPVPATIEILFDAPRLERESDANSN